MPGYLRPRTLDEALQALAERPRLVLAGGTDVYPARVGRPLDDDVLDIGGIEDLRGIAETPDGWRLGALVRWTDVVRAPLPPLFEGLKLAAREVGGPQIQNAGTIAGNLCNASPAADGVPPLLAMAAEVELASARGRRRLPLPAFLMGNRQTARGHDELLVAVHVPRPEASAASHFLKLGARRHLVISIVMVGFVLEAQDGLIHRAGIAVGACAPTARRLPELERRLVGQPAGADLAASVDAVCLAPLRPIDDIRATAAYRLDACLTLLRRGLAELGARSAQAAA